MPMVSSLINGFGMFSVIQANDSIELLDKDVGGNDSLQNNYTRKNIQRSSD